MAERRRRERQIPDQVYRIRDAASGRVLGRIINLSRHGFLTIGPEPVPPHRRLRLQLELGEGKAIPVTAEAVWCRPSRHAREYGAGFRICEISEADGERIERLLGGEG